MENSHQPDLSSFGNRIRYARELLNMNRAKFLESSDLKVRTFVAIESGQYKKLASDKLTLLVRLFYSHGLKVDPDWLITGDGDVPEFVTKSGSKTISSHQERVIKEMACFEDLSPTAICHSVTTREMSPKFNPGDVVGADRLSDDMVHLALNQTCLVRVSDGEIMIRELLSSSTPGRYHLKCSNAQYCVDNNIPVLLENVELYWVAFICWHRIQMQS